MNHLSIIFSPIVVGFISLWPLAFLSYKTHFLWMKYNPFWMLIIAWSFLLFVIVLLYTNVKLFCLHSQFFEAISGEEDWHLACYTKSIKAYN